MLALDELLHEVENLVRVLAQRRHLHCLFIHLHLQLFLSYSLVVHFVLTGADHGVLVQLELLVHFNLLTHYLTLILDIL